MKKSKAAFTEKFRLHKAPTGIQGFDEITNGGLPQGRTSLICGSAGCGKTLFAVEFLVKGATLFNEPGVFMAFEETEQELATNVSSLGFDIEGLTRKNMLIIDHVHIERSEIEETGEYDLEGLFVRLNYAIDKIGAKRVVLDTIESLFSGLPNTGILRAELRRLFRWLKNKGVTALITAERGTQTLTREGLEEYVSDCVILLDNRVTSESSTRRLRIVKYRGSVHGTNEYPFLIDETGYSVLPVTSLGLSHKVTSERISSGIPQLDEMMGNKGFFKGSSILISGSSGTGKTILAANFAASQCRNGRKVLFFTFEESPEQLIRNMKSIGLNLETFVKDGYLKFHASRPLYGLELHLVTMIKVMREFMPDSVIIDPVNTFVSKKNEMEAKSMSLRLIDFMKSNSITAYLTSLTGQTIEHNNLYISSLIDTWLFLRDIEVDGERNRGLYVLKSRGMEHSNKIREFLITNEGVKLQNVYIGPDGVLTGSARVAQEAKEKEPDKSISGESKEMAKSRKTDSKKK